MGDLVPLQKVFEYEGRRVRTLVRDGVPWFMVADVCNILDLSNPTDILKKRLDRDEYALYSIEGIRNGLPVNFVNEAGLYTLILCSRKPEAIRFRRWVTHEVLPALRQTGRYEIGQRRLPQNYLEALEELIKTERDRLALQEQIEEQAPKVQLFDLFLAGQNAQTMTEVAKVLGIGRNKLFAILREQHILNEYNIPYQTHMDAGRFSVREVTINRGRGPENVPQTLVTAKGVEFVAKLLQGNRAVKLA